MVKGRAGYHINMESLFKLIRSLYRYLKMMSELNRLKTLMAQSLLNTAMQNIIHSKNIKLIKRDMKDPLL